MPLFLNLILSLCMYVCVCVLVLSSLHDLFISPLNLFWMPLLYPATEFSYWMANNAPFSEQERVHLLQMHSVVERLLYIWKTMKKWIETNQHGQSVFLTCHVCATLLTSVSEVFTVAGAEGMTSSYVNTAGFIHQITTLRTVDTNKITFQGVPCTENSYFPSYSWLITCCRRCGSLLGWKFQKVRDFDDANNRVDKDTPDRPFTFYGFMASNVKVRTRSTGTTR